MQTSASGWAAFTVRVRLRMKLRAATAWAFRASGSKSAGISAATTPGRYEAMSTVCTSPSMRTVNTVSASAPGAAEGSSGAAPGASSSGRARAMTRQTSAAATIVFMAVPPVLDLCRQKGIQCFDSGSAAGIFYMDRNGIYA